MSKSLDILRAYTVGKVAVKQANKELEAADTGLRLDPERNVITEKEKHQTFVGVYPSQANGIGMLDTGTGSLDKVHVSDGVIVDAEVGDMYALCIICGRVYRVKGNTLMEMED